MSLDTCKRTSDGREALDSFAASRPEKRLGNIFHFPGRIARYIIQTPALWIPLAVLFLATIIFRFTDVDLLLSRQFFVDQGHSYKQSNAHWPLRVAEPWKSLYTLGVYPAWIIGMGGLLVFLISFLWARLKPLRDAGLFFALMLALGPGLLINGVLKPFWGRPRPNDTIPFNGQQSYLPVGEIGNSSDGASFPSGHASMGFYLMAPAFVLYRRRPGPAALFLALGLAGGTIMGLARIVAGSHFTSDVIWSAGVVYFTGLALAAMFRFGGDKSGIESQSPRVASHGLGDIIT
jgi:lipid A 4'-phosphatase